MPSPRPLTSRFLTVVLALGAALTLSPSRAEAPKATTPDRYVPKTGALFNNPLGDADAQRRLFTHIIRTVNSVPAGETIRFAVFSFSDKPMADALLAAHQRGVHVKLIFASHKVYPPMTRLQAALGKNPRASSFAIFCDASCRGTSGEMHAKYFSFSKVSGGHRFITMVGSNNITNHNAEDQWSDLYTVSGERAYYRAYLHWFGQMRWDRPVAQPFVRRVLRNDVVDLTPLDLTQRPDPIRTVLHKVTCQTTIKSRVVPTKVMIASHAWNGDRGRLVAQDVAALASAGCAVKLFYGVGTGPGVRNLLEKAGAELTNGTHRGVFTHEKLMIIKGHVGTEKSTIRVLTGSHNWSDRALGRDDVIAVIKRPTVGQQYVDAFAWMWENG